MKTKLGVIGTNFVSDWLCEAVMATEGIELYAVYSRTEESGRAFCEKHAIPHVFWDMDAFLASGIDAVYIASPTYCHYDHAMAALEKGLHVLCEKPFVMRGADYTALRAKANEKGVVLMEAMRPLHDPAFALVKESLPKLGKIRRVSFEYCQYSSRYDRYKSGEVLNAFTSSVSGGALFDIGIYPLCWCVALFGKPLEVKAASTFLDNGFEGGGTLLLCYDGFQASVTYSKICDSVTASVITGESGSVMIHKMQAPEKLVYCPRGKDAEVLDYTPAPNNLVYEVKDFVRLIQNGEENDFDAYTQALYETLDLAVKATGIRME